MLDSDGKKLDEFLKGDPEVDFPINTCASLFVNVQSLSPFQVVFRNASPCKYQVNRREHSVDEPLSLPQ